MAVHAGADPLHLDEALASMRAQTYQSLRLFVYCDGPLPAAHEDVLARHLRCGESLDCIVRGERLGGLPVGLNILIDRSLQDVRIEYMARMDADDISMPERIARQVEFFQATPDVTVAGTWCIEFAAPGVPTFYKMLPSHRAEVARFMLYRSPLAHPTVMFRRSVFERGHRYDPGMPIMQDYDLWSRLMFAGEVLSNVPEYLLWFRMGGGFFERRNGFRRASGEFKMRFSYARRSGLLKPTHIAGLCALFFVRLMPSSVKRIAYMRLR
jgi:glycosyltransferase involved in cell wall biosynthesis